MNHPALSVSGAQIEGSIVVALHGSRAGGTRIVRSIPKACLEFRPMAEDSTPRTTYRQFDFPKLLLVGEHTSDPVRLIARQLAEAMSPASLRTVFGAAHMGPLTHAATVNTMLASHIMRADPSTESIFCAADRQAA